ncbi:MAG: MATE family efflux transporter [Lachnospiraceae bacterium]|nr:MATE family efflux transporter [Lachnospiraceae bacterium]
MDFSGRSLRKLVIPLVIEQTLAIAMGMADTIMVSSCGEAVVSGISLVDQISILLVGLFTALASGGSIVCAQYLGHGDKDLVSRSSAQLFLAVGFISTLLMGLALVFNHGILNILYRKIEADVFDSASVYFYMIAFSFPFLGLYSAGAALFRAIGNSKISMNVSLASNIINIIGNAILIYIFKLGAAGAGLSTFISRIVSCVMIIWLLSKSELAFRMSIKPDAGLLKKILYIGVPTGIENSIFQIGKLIVSTMTAGLGTIVITANAITGTIAGVQNIPSNSVGTSLITVVGQCIGAGDEKGARKYIKQLMKMAYLFTAVLAVLSFVFARQICLLFNLSPETADLVVIVLRFNCIMTMLFHPTSFALTNAIRAAGDVRYTMLVSISSMWIFRIGLAYILGLKLGFGLLGIWSAMTIDWVVRSICYVYRILSGKWLSHKNAIV